MRLFTGQDICESASFPLGISFAAQFVLDQPKFRISSRRTCRTKSRTRRARWHGALRFLSAHFLHLLTSNFIPFQEGAGGSPGRDRSHQRTGLDLLRLPHRFVIEIRASCPFEKASDALCHTAVQSHVHQLVTFLDSASFTSVLSLLTHRSLRPFDRSRGE